MADGNLARDIANRCFDNGVIIETAGARGQVLKFLAPLTIEPQTLSDGFACLEKSIIEAVSCLENQSGLKSVSK